MNFQLRKGIVSSTMYSAQHNLFFLSTIRQCNLKQNVPKLINSDGEKVQYATSVDIFLYM